jgi:hypothetical protein
LEYRLSTVDHVARIGLVMMSNSVMLGYQGTG